MADKLATAFTPVANPADATLMMLADPASGERQRITIAGFFNRSQGFSFGAAITLAGGVSGNTTFTGILTNTSAGGIVVTNPTLGNVRLGEINGIGGLFTENDMGLRSNTEVRISAGGQSPVTSPHILIKTAGTVQIPTLSGTGTRNVVVDASGLMSAP